MKLPGYYEGANMASIFVGKGGAAFKQCAREGDNWLVAAAKIFEMQEEKSEYRKSDLPRSTLACREIA